MVDTVVLDRRVGDKHLISIKRLQEVMEEINILDVHNLCGGAKSLKNKASVRFSLQPKYRKCGFKKVSATQKLWWSSVRWSSVASDFRCVTLQNEIKTRTDCSDQTYNQSVCCTEIDDEMLKSLTFWGLAISLSPWRSFCFWISFLLFLSFIYY